MEFGELSIRNVKGGEFNWGEMRGGCAKGAEVLDEGKCLL
jgi:hypothetical protein